MADPIVVVGAGGFGREVMDVIDAMNASGTGNWDLLGVFDDSPSDANLDRLRRRDVRHLGSVEEAIGGALGSAFAVGIGATTARRRVAERLEAAGYAAATLIHPSATMGYDVSVGEGAVICAGVRITTNIRIGRHVHLNLNSTVGHDATLGDFVSVNPLASISGDCVVEDEALIGVAAAVLNRVRIGRGATVGGSACVVRDVAPNTVVKGVPAQ
jgi:sugar O-acyltransferase (sialic acid O-acetyltransferase NeuD family)